MEEMKEKKKINKNIVFSVVAVILLVVVVLGATVAYFSAQAQTEVQAVTTGSLIMGFTSGNIVNADWIEPIADTDIETKATTLPFSVTNKGDQHMNLTISLTDIRISDELKDVDFRWGLYNADTGNGLSFGIFSDLGDAKEMVIYRDTIIDAADPDITNNYILRVWIHDDGANQNYMQGKSFSAKVTVDGEAIDYTPESCFTVKGSSITDYDVDTCGTDVVIPKTIGGVTIDKIGDYQISAFYDKGLTSVIIPNTIIHIDGDLDGSFKENNLTHITIPESVTLVSWSAFASNQLETVFIPDTYYSDGEEAFAYNNLKSVVIHNSLYGYDFYNNKNLTNIVLMDSFNGIGSDPVGGTNLTSIEIPSSVTWIEYAAFMESNNLKEIIIRGKNRIEDFYNYEGLTTEGGLPEGVNIIFRP